MELLSFIAVKFTSFPEPADPPISWHAIQLAPPEDPVPALWLKLREVALAVRLLSWQFLQVSSSKPELK